PYRVGRPPPAAQPRTYPLYGHRGRPPAQPRPEEDACGHRSSLAHREAMDVVLLHGERPIVRADDHARITLGADAAVLDPDGAIAQAAHLGRRVRHEQERALAAETVDPVEALALEGGVAHRQRLVDDQDLGLDMGADGEGEPGAH